MLACANFLVSATLIFFSVFPAADKPFLEQKRWCSCKIKGQEKKGVVCPTAARVCRGVAMMRLLICDVLSFPLGLWLCSH
jgi:hypothetical protein